MDTLVQQEAMFACAFTVLSVSVFKQRTDYIAHEVTRRQGRQPAEYCPNPEKIDLGTTYNHNFNPYENFKPSTAIRPKDMLRSADKPKMVAIQSYRGVLYVRVNGLKLKRKLYISLFNWNDTTSIQYTGLLSFCLSLTYTVASVF